MGLIRIVKESVDSVLGEQWKEYFYCDSMDNDVLIRKGMKKSGRHSFHKNSADNIISQGSVIVVNEGQCMMIVDQGKVADICAEAGEYTYDASTEPTFFTGELGDSIVDVLTNMGKRFTFGGEVPKEQKVYYVNTKELTGNKYGTANPVPFRVVDPNIGLDMEIAIRCFGEYSYRISNPALFYTNVAGNVEDEYRREQLDGQLKSELLTALQPAFARISEMGIRYSSLAGHTTEIANVLNEELSGKWKNLRGIEMVSFGVSSVKASEEDEAMIKELQRTAVFRNASMAGAHMVEAQAEAMKMAASNQSTGPMMGFMGMNMAANANGMNIQQLYAMGQNQQAASQTANAGPGVSQPKPAIWVCKCGTENQGKFCSECGSPRPIEEWTCSCGQVNKGKFCSECGKPFPM